MTVLRAKLYECIRRVRAGEVITVTERGVPVAIMTPITACPDDEHAGPQQGREGDAVS